MSRIWNLHGPLPQGFASWFDTFDEAYRLQQGRRPERGQAYLVARKAQGESELPLSVQEVRRVIETAWVLSSGRLLE